MSDGTFRPVLALVTGIAEYHCEVISGIRRALDEPGVPLLTVAIGGFGSTRTPEIVLDLIRSGMTQGVIALADALGQSLPDLAEALADMAVPIVTLGERFEAAPRVSGDNVSGMRALMAHLLDEQQARRLLLVRGVPGYIDSEERERVFREECSRRGIAVDENLVVEGRFLAGPAYEQVRAALKRTVDVDAVVALNDPSALGAMSAIIDAGLRVPDDLLVSGFDDVFDAATSVPPLTTVDQHLGDQGYQAGALLLRMLAGERPAGDLQVASRLVVRASTLRDGGRPADEAATARRRAGPILQELWVSVTRTMVSCRTIGDVIEALGPCLTQIGISRCFIALDRSEVTGEFLGTGSGRWTALAFRYREGRSEPPGLEVYRRHELLPGELRSELERGDMLIQPLSIDGRERGYLLFDLDIESHLLAELLRIELPRTIEMVCGAEDLRVHTASLEQLVARRTQDLERLNGELRWSMMRDGLTGIANRRAFDDYLGQAFRPDPADPPRGPGEWIALLMIDVDLFKAFNDRYGHLAGDDALKTVAVCLEESVRGSRGLACRYGGEEFAVILQGCDGSQALAEARRFADLLATAAIGHDRSPVSPVVTASIGVAAVRLGPASDPTQLMTAADLALYQAKALGRNRIVATEPSGVRAESPS